MTLREQIADWISGGALSRERATVRLHKENIAMAMQNSEKMYDLLKSKDEQIGETWRAFMNAFDALRRIAVQETPNANATVKRMANMAREAMQNSEKDKRASGGLGK